MRLDSLPGSARLKAQLPESPRRLPHAMLLGGPKGSGRHALATLLAQALVCDRQDESAPCLVCPNCRRVAEGIHPDVPPLFSFVSPKDRDKRDIVVDTIRALRSDVFIRPNQARRKVYLIDGAETMNPNAQNALLKVLEDGPDYASFLLIAENPMALLPTIRSRCVCYELTPPARPQEPEADARVTQAAERLTQALGSELELMEWAVAVQNDKLSREQMSAVYQAVTDRALAALAGRPEGDSLGRQLTPARIAALTGLAKEGLAAMERNVSPPISAGWFAVQVWEAVRQD